MGAEPEVEPSLIAAAYWGHPDLYASAGYPGPPNFSAIATPPSPAPGAEGDGDSTDGDAALPADPAAPPPPDAP